MNSRELKRTKLPETKKIWIKDKGQISQARLFFYRKPSRGAKKLFHNYFTSIGISSLVTKETGNIDRSNHKDIRRHRRQTKAQKILRKKEQLRFYYSGNRLSRFVGFSFSDLLRKTRFPTEKKTAKVQPVILKRAQQNPILSPDTGLPWESNAVFNTAAVRLFDKTHFIYRAIGESGLSVFGYAASRDGISIDERSAEPAYISDDPIQRFEKGQKPRPYGSGGSWWGCEDPRLSLVDDTIYMTYTAFDGCQPPCVALTSIGANDFVNRKWNWKKSVLLSEPGAMNKNWVIFPEKINGKFAVLHSIAPKILIEYIDTLDFNHGRFIQSNYSPVGRKSHWDTWVRGVGPPPIKTEDGWLLIYHAMDKNDPGKYKLGAMLLDEKNPSKIIGRSSSPLLEPEFWYENNGHKSGVVYSCGATLVNGQLYVYYGGSDSWVCATMANQSELMCRLKGDYKSSSKYYFGYV